MVQLSCAIQIDVDIWVFLKLHNSNKAPKQFFAQGITACIIRENGTIRKNQVGKGFELTGNTVMETLMVILLFCVLVRARARVCVCV